MQIPTPTHDPPISARSVQGREAPSADVTGKSQSADYTMPISLTASARVLSRAANFLEVQVPTCFRFEIKRMALKCSPINENILLAD